LRAILAHRFDLLLELHLPPQRGVPASLQLGGDESVRRIDRVVLTLCPGRLVARLFEGQRLLPDPLVLGVL
jgi:hypothetical protein